MEPFFAMYIMSSCGASMTKSVPASPPLMLLTVPVPSTCPVTIWPPIRLSGFSACSRFTVSPGLRKPAAVRSRVSWDTSAVNMLPRIDVAVRQMPFTAMESPSFAFRRSSAPALMVRAIPPFTDLIPATVPVHSTIPVNICSPNSTGISADSAAAERFVKFLRKFLTFFLIF